ncbi:MAG TPA: glycosyltransferase family A protein [Bacteroidales bacterium]|nr:glycosyltransferase family A protein [Bacteroidales bacterium]
MGFASSWLEKSALFPQFISEEPDSDTGIITVVPAYNEPDITVLLDSLIKCTIPSCKVEVLIVVNAPPAAPEEHLVNNRISVQKILNWREKNKPFFRLFCFETTPIEGWGVGMARKSGMDEALRRFDRNGNTEGIILSVDADCTVDNNYFTALESELLNKKNRSACSIYFEHEKTDSDRIHEITDYELHLRYYVMGLKYSGYPYPFHTVGSSMAVKALPYMKAGGMNRKQAGEDFYFIQKLVVYGGYFNLVKTTVHPSSRISYRVPFGTGATMEKLSKEQGTRFMTYNIKAFIMLKSLFDNVDILPGKSAYEIMNIYRELPDGIRTFIREEEFKLKISEICNNTGSINSFRKRYFTWFNMFKIVRFMNHLHNGYLEKKPVAESAKELLALTGEINIPGSTEELLEYFRTAEKKS